MEKSRSIRYRELVKEIHNIRLYLLPESFDPLGNYTQEELVKTLAFRVLAHAGFESYLEERAFELAKAATNAWKKERKAESLLRGVAEYSCHERQEF